MTFTNMQVHSCKDTGTDVQWFPDGGMIKGVGVGEGRCVQMKKAEAGSGLDAADCDKSEPLQKFTYCTDGTLRSQEGDLCLVAGPTISEAGPWSKRDLTLEKCSSTTALLRQWSYTSVAGSRADEGTKKCSKVVSDVQSPSGSVIESNADKRTAMTISFFLAAAAAFLRSNIM